ncbi:(Fe-S)-binding protein [Marinomonas algicola]|uniref:(Fe-S)-binding protein n=1 Tax=Marinomonas algicola TaxID=2773454 RepID=UPI00174DA401|nr:(Fe-S)-binding protein [Marinomonas algicola]
MPVHHFIPDDSLVDSLSDDLSSPLKLYPSKPKKVYVFGTCLVDLFYPEAGMSGVLLLEHAGVEVLFPQDQTCCGQPAYTSGYKEEARSVALAQMSLFNEEYPIVVPSGSCGGMMKMHYPRLFEGTEYDQQAQEFSERIYELTDFLVHVCDLPLVDQGEQTKIALHTSCSSRREMKTTDSGKALLKQLKNVNLVEPEKVTECCGFGGAFSVRHPEISNAMVKDKLDHLSNTKADTFLSSDCGCLMNIKGAAEKDKSALTLRSGEHLLSFVARRVGLIEGGSE